ncbi:conserved hypothetical protein [Uncinocarpus reesii 1704]|uniref:Choline transport protein n=1 Tax=Uncinocarpus reesii (strain UAMH 1704) TaxID=336963 RepID=C4JEH7_UNCRE|nr:uncharacterized protein UREG_00816 [Uncinocarpus reesii 1704]EEP75969.1 conserved hypothetical protein [Uncinocarpus reesii 1704]
MSEAIMGEKQVVEAKHDDDKFPVTDSQAPVGLLNASGHKQELNRNFSLLSICAIGITTGNSCIAVAAFYWVIAASLAELASAIPSAAGVYHWATVTAGRHGRPVGFLAGFWNCLAWIFGAASISAILGNQAVSMYTVFKPDLESKPWHVFVTYLICTWMCCCVVLFANRALPTLSNIGMFFIVAVCAIMPHVNHVGYASNSFVWRDWANATGYSSDGFVFLLGMLNGAYSVGCIDLTSHIAEEIPRPSRNIPKAMLAQVIMGFITAIPYMVALFYAITNLDTVLTTNSTFPLATIYHQATGSRGGALGLLIIAFIPTFFTCVGCYITAGRTLWTLARDNATPFSPWLARVHDRYHNPFNASLACGAIITVLGCIYVGSTTAFNAFVGSYVQLSTLSYLAAILPHLLSGRRSIVPGYFYMKGAMGFIVNGISCLYIMAFVVIFCFPFALPTDAKSMNYASLMTGGLTLFVSLWYLFRRKGYAGPKVKTLGDASMAPDAQ